MSDQDRFSVTLRREERFRFGVTFGDGSVATLTMDEPAPLGDDQGPNASEVLAAAVGNCLAASLLFCLQKAKAPVTDLEVTVQGRMARTESGRLRIAELAVRLTPELDGESPGRLQRCLDLFEDFCIVSQSVRAGIPIAVTVTPAPAGATSDAPTG